MMRRSVRWVPLLGQNSSVLGRKQAWVSPAAGEQLTIYKPLIAALQGRYGRRKSKRNDGGFSLGCVLHASEIEPKIRLLWPILVIVRFHQ